MEDVYACRVLVGISMQLHYLAFFLGAIIAVYLLVTNLARFIESRSMSLARVFC